MIFILTGPDGSGKTTLANKLAAITNGSIVKFSYPRTRQEREAQMDMYSSAIKAVAQGSTVIMEHAWYSEIAYGPVKRGKSHISWSQMYALERLVLENGGGCVVYCTGDSEQLFASAQRRGEDYLVDPKEYKQVHSNFDDIFMAPHLIPVFTYSYVMS